VKEKRNPHLTPATHNPSPRKAFLPLPHFIYFFASLPNEQLDQREGEGAKEDRAR